MSQIGIRAVNPTSRECNENIIKIVENNVLVKVNTLVKTTGPIKF